MSKSILMLLLGAFTASCWWAVATLEIPRQLAGEVDLFTVASSFTCVFVIAMETCDVIDRRKK